MRCQGQQCEKSVWPFANRLVENLVPSMENEIEKVF